MRGCSEETADMTAPLLGEGFYCKREKLSRGIWKRPEQIAENRLGVARGREAGENSGGSERQRLARDSK